MRCPKCSYLSYEDVPRCRNCGYDFSLAVPPEVADAPTLDEPAAARAWQEAGTRTPRDPADQMTPLDESTAVDLPLFEPAEAPDAPDTQGAPEPRNRPRDAAASPPPRPRPSDPPLQLDPPPVPIPPAPPPLVVRRTVDVPRPRPATPPDANSLRPAGAARQRPAQPAPAPALDFDEPPRRDDQFGGADEPTAAGNGDDDPWHLPADAREADDDATIAMLPPAGAAADSGLGPRLLAGAIDAGLLIGINLLVVWLTLRLLGLTWGDAGRLPVAPLIGFLALLDVSYLVTFTAASGQSIGKMLTGLRVTSDDGTRVPFGHAVLRGVIVLLCAVPAGLGLLPVLFDAHGRGLHDRMAGTRVGPAE